MSSPSRRALIMVDLVRLERKGINNDRGISKLLQMLHIDFTKGNGTDPDDKLRSMASHLGYHSLATPNNGKLAINSLTYHVTSVH